MGNRAIIAFEGKTTGIYLHWNGGPESIYAFLDYADATVGKERGWDDDYVIARLFQIIGNYFGGSTSVGVADIDPKDPLAADDQYGLDNGVYLVKAAPSNGHGYSVIARGGRRKFKAKDIESEATNARKHDYWTKAETPILKQIASFNDPFFKKP